jgi:hypothetical protein
MIARRNWDVRFRYSSNVPLKLITKIEKEYSRSKLTKLNDNKLMILRELRESDEEKLQNKEMQNGFVAEKFIMSIL